MQSRRLSDHEYLLVFTAPDVEVIGALNDFAAAQQIASGRIQGIGSISAATLAWWNAETKLVETYAITTQHEVVSLLGNISANDTGPRVHAHALLAGQNGVLIGGHAVSLTPHASLEINITTFDTPFTRVKNDDFGLWIIDLSI